SVGHLAAHHSSTLVASLSKEAETLKTLLDEQRQSYEKDRAVRLADERSRDQHLTASLKKQAETIDNLQQLFNQSTKELCGLRHSALILERELRGEIEVLVARAAEAERQLAIERAKRTTDMNVVVGSQVMKAEHL